MLSIFRGAAAFVVLGSSVLALCRTNASTQETYHAARISMFVNQNEPQGEEGIPTRTPAVCLLGRAGPESLMVVAVDSTLYLLAPGQGFLLPWGDYATLTMLSSGSIAVVTRKDTMVVSGRASGTKEWAWASPFHNPWQRGGSSGDMPPSGMIPGWDSRKKDGSEENRPREAQSENSISPEPEHGQATDLGSPERALPEASPADASLPQKSTDLRLCPHPPIVHILGLRHTALMELWYEGSQEIYGIHCFIEPVGEIVSVVSVVAVSDEQEPVSLTSGRSPNGGLQIRLVSESALADQTRPLLNVLLESHAPGTGWVRLEGIVVATRESLWSLPNDSLQVYVEE